VASYRAFIIGKYDHFLNVHVFDAESDQDAVKTAERYVNGVDVEVWERKRFIARLTPSNRILE
jgi:hypothetical protein